MIKIKPSPNADTRTATYIVTKEELLDNSVQHIGDVQKACAFFAEKIIEAGTIHDHTKINGIDDFYDNFYKGLTDKTYNFTTEKWYKLHLTERHHLDECCPEDVTLIDVLEQVADIVMRGLARNGSIPNFNLSAEILQRAYKNTIKLLEKNSEVIID